MSLRPYGGEDGIPLWGRSTFGGLLDLESNVTLYYVCLAILAPAMLLALRLVRSPFFQVIRGAKDNERRMIALGYPVYRYQLVAFVISGMLAGLAGILLANATGFVAPAYLAWTRSGELIVMVVLGGMGTVIGPVIGAAALLLLEEFIPEGLDLVRAGWGEHWRIVLGPFCWRSCCSRRAGCWACYWMGDARRRTLRGGTGPDCGPLGGRRWLTLQGSTHCCAPRVSQVVRRRGRHRQPGPHREVWRGARRHRAERCRQDDTDRAAGGRAGAERQAHLVRR